MTQQTCLVFPNRVKTVRKKIFLLFKPIFIAIFSKLRTVNKTQRRVKPCCKL